MHSFEFWMDIIKNDLDSWDEGTLKANLEIEGVAEDLQKRILAARLSLCESNQQSDP